MIFEIAVGTLIAGQFIYHRWIKDKPEIPRPRSITVPTVDEGTPIPLIYGRCRVRAPVLVFSGNLQLQDEDHDRFSIDLMFVVGIPFNGGSARPFNSGIFAGDVRLNAVFGGVGDHFFFLDIVGPNDISVRGEYFTGLSTQNVGHPDTITQKCMVDAGIDASLIPGYQNQACCAFVSRPENDPSSSTDRGVRMPTADVPSFSFEVRSLSTGTASDLGFSLVDDADPAAVLYDVLTSPWGKVGLPTDKVDIVSFQAASATLFTEVHGYSRAIDQAMDATEIIEDLLKQTDGMIYEEPTTGKFVYKLVRNDYVIGDLDDINPDNASPVGDGWYQVQGWNETINQVRVTYTERISAYEDALVMAQNMANVVTQGGRVRSVDIHYPGCNDRELAQRLGSRELNVLSIPQVKASVKTNRSFYQKRPGDVVTLTWPELGVDHMVMRIVRVDLGRLHEGEIKIDMIRDSFDVNVGAFP